jgi:hypothetical protein
MFLASQTRFLFSGIQGPPCATRPPQHAPGWGLAVSGGHEKLTSEKAGAAETKRDVLMFWSNDARAATPGA